MSKAICPKCGSENLGEISSGGVIGNGEYVPMKGKCLECGLKWTNDGLDRVDKFEALLMRVGSEISDRVNVYPIPMQHNTRILDFCPTPYAGSFHVLFDVTIEETEESVRKRISEACIDRIEWLTGLKDRV